MRKLSPAVSSIHRWALLAFFLLLTSPIFALETPYTITADGLESLKEGQKLFAEEKYEKAAIYFWRAVLLQEQSGEAYAVEDAFTPFVQSYAVQDRTADAFVYIAKESWQRGQKDMAKTYLQQALSIDSSNGDALALLEKFEGGGTSKSRSSSKASRKKRENPFQPNYGTPEADRPLDDKSPEELYSYGATLFSRRNYEQ
jgi:tetratricopeptide (TPR) repeat protein